MKAKYITRKEALILILGSSDSYCERDRKRASDLAQYFRVELPCGSIARLGEWDYAFWPLDNADETR